ncbi:hypothetical protein V6N13_111013 [Hibiscus sabdariffa]
MKSHGNAELWRIYLGLNCAWELGAGKVIVEVDRSVQQRPEQCIKKRFEARSGAAMHSKNACSDFRQAQ